MELGTASWTAAQCGDCLSAQALGHAATPPWARAPALGFQRDVTGDWLSLSGAGPPRYFFTLLQPATAPPNSFTVSVMNPGSPHTPPPTPPPPHWPIPTTTAHVQIKRGVVVLLHCTHLPHVFPCCGPAPPLCALAVHHMHT